LFVPTYGIQTGVFCFVSLDFGFQLMTLYPFVTQIFYAFLFLFYLIKMFYSLYNQEEGQALVSRLLDRMMKCDKYGERRGAAFGLAGVVKGFGISSLKKYGIAATLQQNLEDRLSTLLPHPLVLYIGTL
jgi:hypothetical protein